MKYLKTSKVSLADADDEGRQYFDVFFANSRPKNEKNKKKNIRAYAF